MQTITFVVFDHCMASSISLPLEMLNAADNIRRAARKSRQKLTVQLASHDLSPITTGGGLHLLPTHKLEDIHPGELIIVPALWRSPTHMVSAHPEVVDWLKKQSEEPGIEICAVGTGSTFLAEAGLLDDKAATTHWYYFKEMEKRYPRVKWKRQHLITQSNNLYCAGSVNSVADLAIHFIETGFSASIARKVESQFSPEIRRAYDDYLFDDSENARFNDELMASAQDYIKQNYAQPIDFEQLAQSLGLGLRSFQRRFKAATDHTALHFQQSIRVQNAKELLKATNLNIQEIAEMSGYVDASHFARVFKAHAEQTPREFRNAVRGKLFNASTS